MPYTFESPLWFLSLLLLVPVFLLRRRQRTAVSIVPFAAAWHSPQLGSTSRPPLWLAVCGAVLLITALARPQRLDDRRLVTNKGYDLMLAIDLSGSMLAEDYEQDGRFINRLQTIQPIIKAFINKRLWD